MDYNKENTNTGYFEFVEKPKSKAKPNMDGELAFDVDKLK